MMLLKLIEIHISNKYLSIKIHNIPCKQSSKDLFIAWFSVVSTELWVIGIEVYRNMHNRLSLPTLYEPVK